MKRVMIWLVMFCMIAALTGCASAPLVTGTPVPTVTVAPTIAPSPTVSPEPSPSLTATMVEPTDDPTSGWDGAAYYNLKITVPTTNVYTSTVSGISFTVPESWVGKYRVEEQSSYITVYFNPAESVDKDIGDGELFSIDEKGSDVDELSYGKAVEFDINDITYICGTPKNRTYQNDQPEYDTYVAMQKDMPEVFSSICTATGQLPDNIINNPKPAPMTIVYTSKKLGIKFSLPDSWRGKYRVEENKGCVYVYFKPKKPRAEDAGGIWLFDIEKKTEATAEDEDFMDGVQEVEVNGVTYICGGPTDAYDGPENDTYETMSTDLWAIFGTVRAAK